VQCLSLADSHRLKVKAGDSVTTEMRPGTTAIIVQADEKSTRPVDDIVALGGGHVYRQAA
jgi:hypothetical protein